MKLLMCTAISLYDIKCFSMYKIAYKIHKTLYTHIHVPMYVCITAAYDVCKNRDIWMCTAIGEKQKVFACKQEIY